MATRKNPKRVAAAKKAARTRRRNAAAGKTRTTTTRRTVTRSKKTMLSEVTNSANLKAGGAMILAAAGGAAMADQVTKAMPNQTKLQKVGLLAGLAYIASTALKMPMVGAGFAAVAGLEFFKPDTTPTQGAQSMQENAVGYLSADALEQLPDVISMSEEESLLSQYGDYGDYGKYGEYAMQTEPHYGYGLSY